MLVLSLTRLDTFYVGLTKIRVAAVSADGVVLSIGNIAGRRDIRGLKLHDALTVCATSVKCIDVRQYRFTDGTEGYSCYMGFDGPDVVLRHELIERGMVPGEAVISRGNRRNA